MASMVMSPHMETYHGLYSYGQYAYVSSRRDVFRCAGSRLNMCLDMCLHVCLGMCLHMCVGMCLNMCWEMRFFYSPDFFIRNRFQLSPSIYLDSPKKVPEIKRPSVASGQIQQALDLFRSPPRRRSRSPMASIIEGAWNWSK